MAACGRRNKRRMLYLGLLSLAITCCLFALGMDEYLPRSKSRIFGRWHFRKVFHRRRGIFKIQNGFRWLFNQGSPEEIKVDIDHADTWNALQASNKFDTDDSVLPMNKTVVETMLQYTKRNYTEKVLILSPIHNVGAVLPHYAEMIKSLSYPHELISIALGEDSSTDDTMFSAKMAGLDLAKRFRKVNIFHLNITGGVHGDWLAIHDIDVQYKRRRHLADARNLLLKQALADEDWVLWVDSDVSRVPRDIIQQLLSAEKDIVAPSCVMIDSDSGKVRVYDKNTWQETADSIEHLKQIPPNHLVLEGYGPTHRIWLSNLRNKGRVVPLDGVGGCTLLVRAQCHRKGLVFPNYVYKNHIETEGLAKLAKDMEFGVYGMPFVEVVHS